jgi:hypothetical protein
MMIPPADSYPEQLGEVLRRLIEDGRSAADATLMPIAYAPRALPRRPALPRQIMFDTFRRDGWRCRYCDGKVILSPVFALLGRVFPDTFPYHPNWKGGLTHPAVIARCAVVDHVVPGAWGGSWGDPENLVTACWPCNARKGDLTLDQLGWQLVPLHVDEWDGLSGYLLPLWELCRHPSPEAAWVAIAKAPDAGPKRLGLARR